MWSLDCRITTITNTIADQFSHLEKEIRKEIFEHTNLRVCGFVLYVWIWDLIEFIVEYIFWGFVICYLWIVFFVLRKCFFFVLHDFFVLLFSSVHSVENTKNNLRLFSKTTKLKTWRTNLKTQETIAKRVFECLLFSRTKNSFWKQKWNKLMKNSYDSIWLDISILKFSNGVFNVSFFSVWLVRKLRKMKAKKLMNHFFNLILCLFWYF